MLTVQELIQYCCNKRKSYIDYPFGNEPICIKVKGKIFAEIYPKEDNYKITLKCEPGLADFFRKQYPNVVVRGYHCPASQQPHRNTVYINNIDDTVLFGMIDHSYEQVIKSFPKKAQKEILNQYCNEINL
jgi:predicted DNA-binding protein (MmcQ/YjbR family)